MIKRAVASTSGSRRLIRRMLTKFAALVLLALLGAATAAAEDNGGGSARCQSSLGSPPGFGADNAYYCMTWNKGRRVMQGPFAAGNNTWGANGQIHSQIMTVNPATFPNGTSWTWTWPTPSQGKGISCCAVDSFYALYWGMSGMAASAGPGAPRATQLKAIKNSHHDFQYLLQRQPALRQSSIWHLERKLRCYFRYFSIWISGYFSQV